MIINVGIIGGGGYTAGELLRILLNHESVKISYVTSKSQHGKRIAEIHTDLIGECELIYQSKHHYDIDILFLCLGHNKSRQFLASNNIPKRIKIIDLSQDFRLPGNEIIKNRKFIYGLPEANKYLIENADSIANPGCFATSIEIALLPLVPYLKSGIHIHAITGATGAGYLQTKTSHFNWRANNISVYKAFEHQHLTEVKETFLAIKSDFDVELNMIPIRGGFTRGIFSSMYTEVELKFDEIMELYQDYYKPHPFVKITNDEISLKQVINTNYIILTIRKYKSKVFIVSILDNLMKGAAGQAIQNMNIMFGLNETAYLNTKAVYF